MDLAILHANLQVKNPQGGLLWYLQRAIYRVITVSPPLFYGRPPFGPLGLPHRVPLTTIVGPPLDVGHQPVPTEAQVDAAHAAYCEALRRMFERHAPNCGIDYTGPLVIS